MRVDGFAPRGFDRKRFEAMLPEQYLLLWLSGVDTGLRISDLLTMRVRDLPWLYEGVEITECKTGRVRVVRLSEATYTSIRAYVRGWGNDSYIWPSPILSGRHVHRGSVWRIYTKAAKHAGIKKNIGTHTARKTFAQRLYARSDLETVQEELHHLYPSTTLSYVINPRTRPRKR